MYISLLTNLQQNMHSQETYLFKTNPFIGGEYLLLSKSLRTKFDGPSF